MQAVTELKVVRKTWIIVDGEGNAVSNTFRLNLSFRSGVTILAAGFLMNDRMDDFTSKVGVPNEFGLIQGSANAIALRKRRVIRTHRRA